MGLLQKFRNAIGGGDSGGRDAPPPESADPDEREPETIYRCQRCRTEYTQQRALCEECGGSVLETTA